MRAPVIPAPPARPRPLPRSSRPKQWEALIALICAANGLVLLAIAFALMGGR